MRLNFLSVEIFETVKSGDAKAARTAMHRHLNNARKRYVSNWQKEELFA